MKKIIIIYDIDHLDQFLSELTKRGIAFTARPNVWSRRFGYTVELADY